MDEGNSQACPPLCVQNGGHTDSGRVTVDSTTWFMPSSNHQHLRGLRRNAQMSLVAFLSFPTQTQMGTLGE